jgi:hypothetical protein
MHTLDLLLEQFYRYHNNFGLEGLTVPVNVFYEILGVALVPWGPGDAASALLDLYDAETGKATFSTSSTWQQ